MANLSNNRLDFTLSQSDVTAINDSIDALKQQTGFFNWAYRYRANYTTRY